MRNIRFFCAALALSLVLAPLSPSARAAEAQPLLPSVREYAGAFSDVTGSWCERYVETVYETGLMDGTSAERFDPDSSLTYAQITAITARLSSLLGGGDGAFPPPEDGEAWYQPCAAYLSETCDDEMVHALLKNLSLLPQYPTAACIRRDFVWMLAGVLPDTALPPINEVSCVIDSVDQGVPAFYRAGILNGLDAYGSFGGEASLTRGAAAAMLSRIVDPAQRLHFTLKSFDLCRDILQVSPDTILLTVGERDVTAALFANQLCTSLYQRGGPADNALADAIRFWCLYHAPVPVMAEEKGILLSRQELADISQSAQSMDGYLGLSSEYWQYEHTSTALNLQLRDLYCQADWKTGESLYHSDLERLSQSLLETAAPSAALRAMDLSAVYHRLTASPFAHWTD